MEFKEKKFNVGELKGVSAKTIEEHLKLYAGYVKNSNLIGEKLAEMWKDGAEKHQYEASEIVRRFSFEYNGMRNHEIYFDSLSDGAVPLSEDSSLKKKIEENQGSFDGWLTIFKMTLFRL